MVLTKEQCKIVRENLKAVRLAFKCKNSNELYIRLNSPKSISADTLYKIEKGYGHYKELTDTKVQELAGLLGLSFNVLLSPGAEQFITSDSVTVNPDELLSEENISRAHKIYCELFKLYFPLMTTERTKQLPDFCKAMQDCEAFVNDTYLYDEYLGKLSNAVDVFQDSGIPEGYMNALSIFGYFLMNEIYHLSNDTIKRMATKEIDDALDFSSFLFECIKSKEESERKAKMKHYFLGKYDGRIFNVLSKLNVYEEYKDYVYYFLAIKYYLQLMENEKVNMDEFEMERFGFSLLQHLEVVGNKYAKNFFNFKY